MVGNDGECVRIVQNCREGVAIVGNGGEWVDMVKHPKGFL